MTTPRVELTVRCDTLGCAASAVLVVPEEDGDLDLSPLAGWTFSSATDWQCPEHTPALQKAYAVGWGRV